MASRLQKSAGRWVGRTADRTIASTTGVPAPVVRRVRRFGQQHWRGAIVVGVLLSPPLLIGGVVAIAVLGAATAAPPSPDVLICPQVMGAGQTETPPVDAPADGATPLPDWADNLPPAGKQYAFIFDKWGRQFGVDPRLAAAVAWAESGFSPLARSSAGAGGIMQLMPATAASLGVTDRFNPDQSIMGGTRMLAQLLVGPAQGNISLALVGYNAGPGRIPAARNGVMPGETRAYVPKVIGYYGQLGGEAEAMPGVNPDPNAAPPTPGSSSGSEVDPALLTMCGLQIGGGPAMAGAPAGPVAAVGPPSGVLANVNGIQVDSSIADNLARLLAHAARDGIHLSGWGYRDTQRQIELRRINGCPDIYNAPASTCRVPTARPGQSMHEKGLAVDLTQGGRTLGWTSSGHLWVKQHGPSYGFFLLASEPWHISVNGK